MAKLKTKSFGMRLISEKRVKMVELKFDVDDKYLDAICAYAMREIRKDRQALFNYGVTLAIKNFIEESKCKKHSNRKS